MGTTVTKRRCKFSGVIDEADWEAQKNPVTARAYIESLTFTDVAIVDSKRTRSRDASDATNSQDGEFSHSDYGHRKADGSVTLQFNHYNRPPAFDEGEIRALLLYLNIDGTDAPITTPGAENVFFIGFVNIESIDESEPQHGVMPVMLKLVSRGYYTGDIPA